MNPIREAISRLPGHWHKGSLHDNQGNYCGVGHLRSVLIEYESDKYWESIDLLSEVAKEQYPDRVNGLFDDFPNFNDHPDTTEDEVIAVMEKAAVRWDERI